MKCPHCAEDIKEEANKCRFCGEWLNTPTPIPNLAPTSKKSISERLPRWLQGTVLFALIVFAFMHPVLIILPVAWTIFMRGPWWLLWLGFVAWSILYRATATEVEARGAAPIGWLMPAYYFCIASIILGVVLYLVNGWKEAGKKVRTEPRRLLKQEILARLRIRADVALIPLVVLVVVVVRLLAPGTPISDTMRDLRSQPDKYATREMKFRAVLLNVRPEADGGYSCALVDPANASRIASLNQSYDILYAYMGPLYIYGLSNVPKRGSTVDVTGRFEIGSSYRFTLTAVKSTDKVRTPLQRPDWISKESWILYEDPQQVGEVLRMATGTNSDGINDSIGSLDKEAQTCRASMKLLSDSKNRWAIELKQPPHTLVSTNEMMSNGYLQELPSCPAGGKLILGLTEESPSCSVHGDLYEPTPTDKEETVVPSPTENAPVESALESNDDSLNGERYPETRLRVMTGAEINDMNYAQSRYAINEMYARHGIDFINKAIAVQFTRFSWYEPKPKQTASQTELFFTETERDNFNRLVIHRDELYKEGHR